MVRGFLFLSFTKQFFASDVYTCTLSKHLHFFFPFHPLFFLLFVTLDGVVCTNNQWGGAVRSLQVWFSVMLDSVL